MQSHALFNLNDGRDFVRLGFFVHSFSRLGLQKSSFSLDCRKFNGADHKLNESRVRRHKSHARYGVFRVRAMDEDFSFGDWSDSNTPTGYVFSSSEGEESDGDIILQPITDIDLPTPKDRLLPAGDSIAVAAQRFGMLGRTQRKTKILYGMLNNVGIMSFSTILLLLVDQCAWRIVRLPLPPFHLMRPFLMSLVSVACFGYISVPLFRILKLRSMYRKGAASQLSSKRGIPTMGGIYFVPIGLLVAELVLCFSSIDVTGVVAATSAFASIGLLDDLLSLNNNNSGRLPGWVRLVLEVAVGIGFSYWLYTANVSTPYSMKMVIPLPAPLGLVCLGKFYPILTLFCFVSMANGIDLTDGLDGLTAGTAALALIGMSIVALPICSDLAVFGTSMAGACVGFLFQNRYKASIFMGKTGALALAGALAAMASCTGMFFPLFISSGIYVLEALSFIIQASKYFRRAGFRLFRMAPFHHHLRLLGIREPFIVAAAYAVSCLLTLCAAYVGLTSA